jgi:hypothetical protein
MHFLLDPLDAKHGFGHKAMLDFSANIRKECFDLPWTANNHGTQVLNAQSEKSAIACLRIQDEHT